MLTNASSNMFLGQDRQSLMTKNTELTKELEKLRLELAAYSEHDPVEVERKMTETVQARADIEKFSDQILSMEGWIRSQFGLDRESMSNILKMLYGDEYDEEEGGLRDL